MLCDIGTPFRIPLSVGALVRLSIAVHDKCLISACRVRSRITNQTETDRGSGSSVNGVYLPADTVLAKDLTASVAQVLSLIQILGCPYFHVLFLRW